MAIDLTASSTPAGPAAHTDGRDRSGVVAVGRRAWGLIGIGLLTLAGLWLLARLEFVVVPLTLALLPAAALMPLADRLRRRGARPALAASLVLIALVGGIALIVALAAPGVVSQLGALGTALRDATARLQDWLTGTPLGAAVPDVQTLGDRAAQLALGGAGAGERLLGVVDVAARGTAELLLGMVVLFFYLKDGRVVAGWLHGLFPLRWRSDVAHVGVIAWGVLGGYIRGQLIVAAADGAAVAIGLTLLGVPLSAVLGVLVAFFALFPMVGAFIGGGLAVLVAFADGGPGLAIAVVALLVAVFQLEAHVLSPLVLGRSVRLHPLAVIVALSCGGVLRGVVGALVAVPIAACAARIAGYLRTRTTAERLTDQTTASTAAIAAATSRPEPMSG